MPSRAPSHPGQDPSLWRGHDCGTARKDVCKQGVSGNTVQLVTKDQVAQVVFGLGPVGVAVSFDLPSRHLPLDHSRCGTVAACGQQSGGETVEEAAPVAGAVRGENRPRGRWWARAIRSAATKLIRSGS